MPSRPALAALPLLLALLAGCAGDRSPAEDTAVPADPALAIEGIVVSSAIVPLANVSLRLEPAGLDAVSDLEGRFRFEDLREGTYTLQATRGGYVPSTMALQPGGGLVKVVLDTDTQVASYVDAYSFDGFIERSVNLGGARTSSSSSPNYTIGLRAPDLIQFELVWQSTQALGGRLDLTAIANDGNVTLPVAGRAEGPSPLLLRLNRTVIEEFRFGPGVLLDMALFAGQEPVAADRGAGLVVSQSYRLITHMFYGYLPPEDWRFSSDGEPPGPP